MKLQLLLLLGTVGAFFGGVVPARPADDQPLIEVSLTRRHQALSPEVAEKILALDPEHVSERDIREVLSNAPAPRIIMIQGGLLPIQVAMKSFSKFIIGMGYPEWRDRKSVV